ncbi:hypothetical protein ACIF6K_19060 [Streptomyces sp. NPDC085942]|uniref:hypothetical protein n=1 Tax=Streptomyces sp. NPDC085942 TaxID=3365743 RepID=UPI0037D3537D
MNRRLSVALAAYGVWNQAILLFLFEPLKEWVSGFLPVGTTVGEVRLLGLSFDGFAVRDPEHAVGWVPQLLFLVVSGLLMYGVFRGSATVRPRVRAVVALGGALLLASGAAMLIAPALDPGAASALPAYGEWVVRAQLGEVPAAAAQFALLTLWVPLIPWFLVWRYRALPPLRDHFGTMEDAESREDGPEGAHRGREKARTGHDADHAGREETQEPQEVKEVQEGPAEVVPRAVTARERRHLVCAGLIPAVLLAVAGGPVLRHVRVRYLSQGAPGSPDASITFDPDLWNSYTPPPLVAEWSGVLYPALRLRPLRTEMVAGWTVTLVVCAVFLGVLALALRSVATRSAGLVRRPPAEPGATTASAPAGPAAYLGLVMKGWYATLLAAVVAAFVDGRLLRWFAPRRENGTALTDHLGVALGDAVRFGAAWGWTTGLACLAVVLLMARRAAPAPPAPPVAPRADAYEKGPDHVDATQPSRQDAARSDRQGEEQPVREDEGPPGRQDEGQPVRECEEQSAHGE